MEIPEWIDASHGEKSKVAGSLKSALPVFEWLRGARRNRRPDRVVEMGCLKEPRASASGS